MDRLNEYQDAALRTAVGDSHTHINCALGVAGEAGEVADAIKKYQFQGHDLDKHALALELGDLLWYVAVTADVLDYSLSTIAQMNDEKLRKRYPEGFSYERSVNRDELD